MATTDAMTRLVLGTDRVQQWRPDGLTTDTTCGYWILALVAGASESDSEEEAELDRDVACAEYAARSWSGGHVAATVRHELTLMGQGDRINRWAAILRGDVKPNERVLLDDGYIELKVLGVEGKEIRARVVNGGLLKQFKGINLPGSRASSLI